MSSDKEDLFVVWSSGGPVEVDYRDPGEVWLHLPSGGTVELMKVDVEKLLRGFDEQ